MKKKGVNIMPLSGRSGSFAGVSDTETAGDIIPLIMQAETSYGDLN